MQSKVMLGLVLAAFAALPAAAQTAPADVSYAEGAIEASLTGTAGDAASGAKIMGSRAMGNCVACHEITGLGAAFPGNVGPMLDGVGSRWSEAELRGIVANAKLVYDGTIMPAFYKVDGFTRPGNAYTGKAAETLAPLLTAQQIEDVLAFLMTLTDE